MVKRKGLYSGLHNYVRKTYAYARTHAHTYIHTQVKRTLCISFQSSVVCLQLNMYGQSMLSQMFPVLQSIWMESEAFIGYKKQTADIKISDNFNAKENF